MSNEVEKWKQLYEKTKREKDSLSVAKSFFEQKYINSVTKYAADLSKLKSEHVTALENLREAVKKIESKLDDLSKNINSPDVDQKVIGQLQKKNELKLIKYAERQQQFMKLLQDFETELASASIEKLKTQAQAAADDVLWKFEEKLRSTSVNYDTLQKRIDKLQAKVKLYKMQTIAKKPVQLSPYEKSVVTIQRIYRGHLQRRKFREIVHTFIKSPHAKKLKERNKIIREILKTERTYVNNLKTIKKLYIEPLKTLSLSNKPLLKFDKIDKIFLNVEQILALHQIFLLNLEYRLLNWPRVYIGDVFLNQAPLFFIYIEYVNKYDSAMESLRKQQQKNPEFEKFLINAKSKTEGGLSLQSLTILPVQRLPRYQLLLAQLLKNTDKEHVDYHNLLKAHNKICNIITAIDQTKGQYENAKQLEKVRSILKRSKKELELEGKEFVFSGPLRISKDGQKPRPYFGYLFSDMIMFCVAKKESLFSLSTKNYIDEDSKLIYDSHYPLKKEHLYPITGVLAKNIKKDQLEPDKEYIHLSCKSANSTKGTILSIEALSSEPNEAGSQSKQIQDKWLQLILQGIEQNKKPKTNSEESKQNSTNILSIYESIFSFDPPERIETPV